MIAGTFREWVDDGSWGQFIFDYDGVKQTIQVTSDYQGDGWFETYYAVSVAPDRYRFAANAVADGLLAWETPGEVIDG